MESKYLVGFNRNGQPLVMWDRIEDFDETLFPNGDVKEIRFKENGVDYHYDWNDEYKRWVEVNNKAPEIYDYQYMGRRTALRHDYLNPENRQEARPGERPTPDFWPGARRVDPSTIRARTNRNHELEDDSDDDVDDFLRRRAAGSSRRRERDGDYEPVTVDGDDGVSCGSDGYFRRTSPCGGEEIYTRGACGGYIRVYGDGPCGAVMRNICGYSSGCGNFGGCF